MTFVEACRISQTVMQRFVKGVIPVVLIGFVLILSLFAGAVISSIFVHAVEF
jgi:hypothetical protein